MGETFCEKGESTAASRRVLDALRISLVRGSAKMPPEYGSEGKAKVEPRITRKNAN